MNKNYETKLNQNMLIISTYMLLFSTPDTLLELSALIAKGLLDSMDVVITKLLLSLFAHIRGEQTTDKNWVSDEGTISPYFDTVSTLLQNLCPGIVALGPISLSLLVAKWSGEKNCRSFILFSTRIPEESLTCHKRNNITLSLRNSINAKICRKGHLTVHMKTIAAKALFAGRHG